MITNTEAPAIEGSDATEKQWFRALNLKKRARTLKQQSRQNYVSDKPLPA